MQPGAQGLFAGGIGLLMLGLLMLRAAQNKKGGSRFRPRLWLQLLVAAGSVFVLATIGLAQPVHLLITTGIAFILQLAAASERVGGVQ